MSLTTIRSETELAMQAKGYEAYEIEMLVTELRARACACVVPLRKLTDSRSW